MIYEYKGIHNCDCKCDLRIKGNVVVVSELENNPGTSITNAAEDLANQVCEEFGIDKEKVVWFECYEYRNLNEYAMVKFEIDSNGEFYSPNWVCTTKEYTLL